MHSPELYILVAVGFTLLLSFISSRFRNLPLDLFNAGFGFLFGATANLALMEKSGAIPTREGQENLVLTDWALFLALLQFAFGVFVLSSYFAAKNIREKGNMSQLDVRLRETCFYSFSALLSLYNCYIMAILFMNSNQIFAPVTSQDGELVQILTRFIMKSPVSAPVWITVYFLLGVLWFFRKDIARFAHHESLV